MDVSTIASTSLPTSQTGDAIQVSVLKKAMDIETQGAMALINAIPQVSASGPAHLGQNINTAA